MATFRERLDILMGYIEDDIEFPASKNTILLAKRKEKNDLHAVLTGSEIGKICGASPAAVSKWIQNRDIVPGLKYVQKLAKAFNVSPLWIIGETDIAEIKELPGFAAFKELGFSERAYNNLVNLKKEYDYIEQVLSMEHYDGTKDPKRFYAQDYQDKMGYWLSALNRKKSFEALIQGLNYALEFATHPLNTDDDELWDDLQSALAEKEETAMDETCDDFYRIPAEITSLRFQVEYFELPILTALADCFYMYEDGPLCQFPKGKYDNIANGDVSSVRTLPPEATDAASFFALWNALSDAKANLVKAYADSNFVLDENNEWKVDFNLDPLGPRFWFGHKGRNGTTITHEERLQRNLRHCNTQAYAMNQLRQFYFLNSRGMTPPHNDKSDEIDDDDIGYDESIPNEETRGED